jgi:cell division protein FtsL
MAKKTRPKKNQPKSKKRQSQPKKSQSKRKKKKGLKKGILFTFIVIAVILSVGVFYLLNNLNMIVKMAIEKYGSEATKTAVRVGSVKISLKNGSGAIHGLTVANPDGFDARHAFSLGEIGIGIGISSLAREVKVIDDVTIRAPKIFVEINKDNKNNLSEIQKNLPAGPAGAPKPKPTKKKEGKEPRLIVRRFLFSGGLIHAKAVPLNKEYDLNLPAFEMRNIGGKNGATPAEIAKQVIGEITSRSLVEVRKKSVDQGLGKVTDQAKNKMKGLLRK